MNDEEENRSRTSHLPIIRRNQLRENHLVRTLPYDSSSSANIRHRIESTNNEENRSETFISEVSSNDFLLLPPINDENSSEDFQVFVNLSETSQNDQRSTTDEYYQSFHGEELDDEHSFVYATSINPIDLIQNENNELIDHENLLDEDLSIEILLDHSTAQNNSSIIRPSISSRRQRRRRSILPSNLHSHRGLRPIDIRNIPQKFYASLNNDKSASQCSICFEDFQSIDTIKILHCQHIFHAECLNEWLRSHVKCAYCRTPVLIDFYQRRQRRRVEEEHRL